MRTGMRFLASVLASLAVTVAVAAQAPARPLTDPVSGLTIDQAIDEALRNDPLLGASRAEIIAARGEHRQATLWPNPDVMVEQREQFGGTDRQTGISMDLPLDVFRRGARIEAAERAVTVAERSTLEAERRVAVAVREAYGQVLDAARREAIAAEVVDASRRTYELLRGRAAEGAAPPLERDVSLVEWRRMESLHEQAASRLAVAASALTRLLGRPAGTDLILRDSLESIVGRERSVGTEGAPALDRADVQEAAAQVAMAQARTEEAKQDAKPSLAVFGSYMRMDQGFSQSGINALGQLEPVHGRFYNGAIGVRLSIPLFDRAQGNVAAAGAREVAANERLRARRLDAASERATAAARLDAARRAAGSFSADGRALARRNLDVMRETYALGRVTLFDVINEQRRYLDFESFYTDVLAEVFAAVTALRGATGEIR
jgi:cobalt-zinc-cadmium efflux system outer membrane protein